MAEPLRYHIGEEVRIKQDASCGAYPEIAGTVGKVTNIDEEDTHFPYFVESGSGQCWFSDNELEPFRNGHYGHNYQLGYADGYRRAGASFWEKGREGYQFGYLDGTKARHAEELAEAEQLFNR